MACVRYIGETRASSNSSKNHTFLISRIWKMGRNLFSSLAIKDNLKVAYLEKNSNNPKICLVTGSGFFELSILCNCTTVWGTGCVRNLSWDYKYRTISKNVDCTVYLYYCTAFYIICTVQIFLGTFQIYVLYDLKK